MAEIEHEMEETTEQETVAPEEEEELAYQEVDKLQEMGINVSVFAARRGAS